MLNNINKIKVLLNAIKCIYHKTYLTLEIQAKCDAQKKWKI